MDHRPDRLQQALLAVATACVVVALVLAFLAWRNSRAPQWNPLGVYSLQVVHNPGHVVHADGTLDVTATKCAIDASVAVLGSSQWQVVGHADVSVLAAVNAPAVRYQSCGPNAATDHFSYHDPIPSRVADFARQGFKVWELTGSDVPIDGKRQGQPRTWTTEPFTVIP